MFVRNSCTPVHAWADKARQEIENERRKNREWFRLNTYEHQIGFPTWRWQTLPEVRQKPLDPKLADPKCWFFGRGAHMPILVLLQNKKCVIVIFFRAMRPLHLCKDDFKLVLISECAAIYACSFETSTLWGETRGSEDPHGVLLLTRMPQTKKVEKYQEFYFVQ